MCHWLTGRAASQKTQQASAQLLLHATYKTFERLAHFYKNCEMPKDRTWGNTFILHRNLNCSLCPHDLISRMLPLAAVVWQQGLSHSQKLRITSLSADAHAVRTMPT